MNAFKVMALALLVSVPVFAQTPQKVTFVNEDHQTLAGTFYQGSPNFVLLSSQHRTSQFAWQEFAETLAEKGYSVLTYDYRGIGGSEGEYSTELAVRDVVAAYRFLKERGAKSIVLIGASMGAGLTFKAGLDAKGTVLVSPNFGGDPAFKGPKGPLLFITSSYDFSRKDTEALFASTTEPKEFFLARGQDHGNGIIDGQDERVRPLIYDFLEKVFR